MERKKEFEKSSITNFTVIKAKLEVQRKKVKIIGAALLETFLLAPTQVKMPTDGMVQSTKMSETSGP